MKHPSETLIIDKALSQIGFLSEADFELLIKKATFKELDKNDLLLRIGSVCKKIYFIQSGALYQYKLEDIEERIIDLHIKNEWFSNYTSFMSQQPSEIHIKAFEPCQVMELSIESIHELIETSPSFLSLATLFGQSKERIYFFDNALTPTEKYQYLLEHRPFLVRVFPLKMIASYLKITPETLSRIRSKN